jgi:hypothetical protein
MARAEKKGKGGLRHRVRLGRPEGAVCLKVSLGEALHFVIHEVPVGSLL